MRVAQLPFRVSLALVVAAAACARGGAPAPVSAADVAALEAERAAQPGDPDINLKLARAYYGTTRWADARGALGTVLRTRPADGEAQAYLALTYEELQHFDSARAVYTGLAATKQSKDVDRLIRGRVVLLERRELQAAARHALTREAQLSATPPDPNTVAVMPFRYTGQDTTLRPLERGLAALVVTDLSQIKQFTLVERERLQALLDELQLAAAGRVDPATGARSGRLMGAGQVVQGQFREVPTANFRIDATAVRASDAGVAATGSGSDQLRQLFDIEKTVVLQLVQRMGITLTPAERQAIQERPTRDVQAFLLYSRGLEARDRGDFAAAARAFQAAALRDPTFRAAAEQAAASEAAVSATTAPASALAAGVQGAEPPGGVADRGAAAPPRGETGTTLRTAVDGAVPSGVSQIDATTGTTIDAPATAPNRLSEAAGNDGPARAVPKGGVTIIIRRP